MSKPRDRKESHLRSNRAFVASLSCCMSGSVQKGIRIGKRRWKQALSKHVRRLNKSHPFTGVEA